MFAQQEEIIRDKYGLSGRSGDVTGAQVSILEAEMLNLKDTISDLATENEQLKQSMGKKVSQRKEIQKTLDEFKAFFERAGS